MEIFNEACTKVLEKIDSESVDLVVTDPLYHIISGGASEGRKDNPSEIFNKDRTREYVKGEDGKTYLKGTKHQTLNGILHDSVEYTRQGKLFKFNDIKFSDWLPEIYRVLKKNTHCYIMINPRNLKELQEEAEKVGFKFQQLIVWDKGNIVPNKYYLNAYELILMLRKGKAKNINNMGDKNILMGKTLIVDELDSSINPVIIVGLINLFTNNEINKKGAQLIFTTHNPVYLANDLLRRDEIEILEKDENTLTTVGYTIADIKGVRKGESLLKNYLAGKYGPIHEINFENIIKIFEKVSDEK